MLNNCRRAQAAEYRHGNRRGCLKGTRDTVLNEIESWANDPHKSPVFWLNGLAGTGKTTIAQTIAERFFAEGRLGASFFCSRDSEDRSNLHFIFPTLAFQLSHKYPDFRSLFVSLLHSNPDVIHESLYNQMQTLITEPLREIGVSTVIVIDALDECKDDEPSSAILSVLARFVEEMPEAKFFITGRPEPRIKTGFRLPLLVDSTDVFVLHDVHPSLVENDIRIYLKHELSELAQRRQLEGWPSNEHVNLLCSRAAGLFVYAVATVKFLDSATHLTEHRFNVILNLPEGTTPEGKTRFNSKTTLDSLYTSILQTAFPEEDPEVDLKVRTTLGAIVTVVNPLPPPAIARLIRLESKEVMLYLTLIQSLLAIDEDPNRPVRPFHKSFPDFITDPLRCVDTRFYISPAPVHLQLAMNCLGLMNDKLEQNLLSLPEYSLNSEVKDLQTRIDDRVSIALQYACRSWHSHLTETRGESAGFIPYLRIFLEEKFLAWLEVLSVLSDVGSASAGLEKLMDWLKEVRSVFFVVLVGTKVRDQVAEDSHLLDTARDCFRFVTKFFEPISVSATHIYHSALELSPISSIVRKLYYNRSHGLTHVPRVMVGTPDSWDTKISISGKHDYTFGTWSPCGQFIAAHTEETIEIRNHLTFELLTSLPSNNYTSPTWGPLAYSPDGRSLACGFSKAIIIWDIQTGGVAKKIKCGGDVISLVWSLDGERISTELCYKTSIRGVEMYDIVSGAQLFAKEFEERSTLYLWACEKSFGLLEVAFPSPNFTLKISSSVISTSEIVTNSFRIESFRAVEGVQPTALTFSPSTHHILVFDDYKHYCVFDIRTSDCLLDCSSHAYYSQFSPDGSLLAIGNGRIIHMYKCTPGHYTNLGEITFLCRSSPCFSFSPTSSSILTWSANVLKVERSDDWHPSTSRTYRQYAAISYSGSRIATAREEESTVTIVDLHSQAPVQVIDTGAKIDGLIITGNVLLVATGGEKVTAWLVMGGRRLADGVVDNERASRSDSIWSTRSSRYQPDFNVEGHLGVIGGNLDSLSSTTQKPVRFSTGRTTCPDTSAVLRCTPTNKLIVENITAFVTTIYPHKTLPPKTIGWFCGSRRKRYGG